jgi:hypothetical protein
MAWEKCLWLHVAFPSAFLHGKSKRIPLRALGLQKSKESIRPLGPMMPGPIGAAGLMRRVPIGLGPGPGPLLIGCRPQQKHFLEKSDLPNLQKWCLIHIFLGNKRPSCAQLSKLSAHPHMLMQDLKAQIAQGEADRDAKAESKAKNLQNKADANGDLKDTTTTMNADKKYLADLTATCEQKASDFESRHYMLSHGSFICSNMRPFIL